MINLSSIKMHMYCPMSLYLKTHTNIEDADKCNQYLEIKNLKIIARSKRGNSIPSSEIKEMLL